MFAGWVHKLPHLRNYHPHLTYSPFVCLVDIHCTGIQVIYVWAHTAAIHADPGGGTNHVHKIKLTLGSGGIYSTDLYDQPGTNQASSGKSDFWILSIHSSTNGFSIPSSTCVTHLNIDSISVVATGGDGWLIKSITTIMRDAIGRHQLLTFDVFPVGRWLDKYYSTAQVGANPGYDPKAWDLTKGNFC